MTPATGLFTRTLLTGELDVTTTVTLLASVLEAIERETNPTEQRELAGQCWPALVAAYATSDTAAQRLLATTADPVLGLLLFSQGVSREHVISTAARVEARGIEFHDSLGALTSSAHEDDIRWYERFELFGPRLRLAYLRSCPAPTRGLLEWLRNAHTEVSMTRDTFLAEVAKRDLGLAHLAHLLAGDVDRAQGVVPCWVVGERDFDLVLEVLEEVLVSHPERAAAYVTKMFAGFSDEPQLLALAHRAAAVVNSSSQAGRDLAEVLEVLDPPKKPRRPELEALVTDLTALKRALAAGTLDDTDLEDLCHASGFALATCSLVAAHWGSRGEDEPLQWLAVASAFELDLLKRVKAEFTDPVAAVEQILDQHEAFHDGDAFVPAPDSFLDVFKDELAELATTEVSVLEAVLAQELLRGGAGTSLVLAGPAAHLFKPDFEGFAASTRVLSRLLRPQDWEALVAIGPSFEGSVQDLVTVIQEA